MYRIIACLVLSLSSFILQGQNIQFVASANEREVAVNSTFMVTYSINVSGTSFEIPDFEDFDKIAGPSTLRSKRIVNGNVTVENSYKITLMAKKEGTFTLPPATIKVNGKTLKTNTLSIKVVKGSTLGSLVGTGKTFIRMETKDTIAYPGQRITLKYMLYTKENVAGMNLMSQSDFKGFHQESVDSPRGYNQVKIDGEDYYARTLLTYYLYPHQTGVFEIDPFTLKVSKPIKNGRVNIFGQVETKGELTRSNALTIRVKNLPSGAPVSFSGAVGKFAMNASIVTNKEYSTNDAILMNMEVQGTGDQKFWNAPDQPSQDNLEYYDPKTTNEQWVKSQWGNASYKSFEYLLVPKEKGNYVIQPEFTYFDVDSLDYITLRSKSFLIRVKRGSSAEIITGLDEEFQVNEESKEGSKMAWIAFPVLLLVAGGFWFFRRGSSEEKEPIDHEAERKKKAKAVAIAALSGAKNHIDQGNEKEFYTEISLAINKYLGDKFDILSSDRTPEKVESTLHKYNISSSQIKEYADIMQKCQLAIYAKMSSTDITSTYERALALIQSMED